MESIEHLGKLLLVVGGAIVLVGAILLVVSRIPGFGRLPGDLVIERPGFTWIAPIATMLVVSIILTILLNVLLRLLNR